MKSQKRALITGVNGQDGYFLSRFLIEQDYCVFGIGKSIESHDFLSEKYEYIQCDITDFQLLETIIRETKPHEIYNLAAISSVEAADLDPMKSYEINVLSLVNLLELVRINLPRSSKVFHASSSLVFEPQTAGPINELTHRNPNSVYAQTKFLSELVCQFYRKEHSIFVSVGIPFNHEGRGIGRNSLFVKILKQMIEISTGQRTKIEIYNIDETRDLGYAEDFVQGFWKSLQLETPEDFVFSTGISRTLSEMIEMVSKVLGIQNLDLNLDSNAPVEFQLTDERVSNFGDNSKAKKLLDWEPRTDLTELIENLVKDLTGDVNFFSR